VRVRRPTLFFPHFQSKVADWITATHLPKARRHRSGRGECRLGTAHIGEILPVANVEIAALVDVDGGAPKPPAPLSLRKPVNARNLRPTCAAFLTIRTSTRSRLPPPTIGMPPGPRVQFATIIVFKQIEFFDHTPFDLARGSPEGG
jgi:hypothetical protein